MKNGRLNLGGMVSLMLLPAMVVAMTACEQAHTIEGRLKGLGNEDVIITVVKVDANKTDVPEVDTVAAENGKFVYDPVFEQASFFVVEPMPVINYSHTGNKMSSGPRMVFLLLEPGGKVSVKGELADDHIKYSVSGKGFNSDFAQVRQLFMGNEMKIDSLQNVFNSNVELPRSEREAVLQDLMSQRAEYMVKTRSVKMEYLKANMDKDLAAYFLLQQPIDSFGVYYTQLSEAVREGVFVNKLDARQQMYETQTASQAGK